MCVQCFQRKPEELADPDSLFTSVNGFQVHYKCRRPAQRKVQLGIHLLHGTANNMYLWKDVLEPLAERCQACVVASDMIGHGLTARPRRLWHCSSLFNSSIGRAIMNLELKKCDTPKQDIKGIVLIGNSLGGLVQILEAIREPQGISAIIVTSPVLVFPDEKTKETLPLGLMHRLVLIAARVLKHMLRTGKAFALWSLQPLMYFPLRSMLRKKTSWLDILNHAYASRDKLEQVIDRFRYLLYRL